MRQLLVSVLAIAVLVGCNSRSPGGLWDVTSSSIDSGTTVQINMYDDQRFEMIFTGPANLVPHAKDSAPETSMGTKFSGNWELKGSTLKLVPKAFSTIISFDDVVVFTDIFSGEKKDVFARFESDFELTVTWDGDDHFTGKSDFGVVDFRRVNGN
ncbi:MAG: hypothetical protein IH944_05335 [Armatimonadetes bacterium]|nr:hypothetical protein [Armatimonadota bacterium]